jgi:hypothetical protein
VKEKKKKKKSDVETGVADQNIEMTWSQFFKRWSKEWNVPAAGDFMQDVPLRPFIWFPCLFLGLWRWASSEIWRRKGGGENKNKNKKILGIFQLLKSCPST